VKLNEDVVKGLPTPEKGNRITYFPNAILQGTKTPPGFGVRVTAGGARSFVLTYRTRAHVERRMTVGAWPTWSVLAAVKEARELRRRVDRGEDPLAERRKQEASTKETFRAICEEYLAREGGKLRRRAERERALQRHVYPVLGDKDIAAIKRSDIVRLLDKIEDGSGATMATRTLAYIGRVFNWHAARSDDFRSPIVRGMGRVNAKERARQRVLNDDEIRAVWKAAETFTPPFGALARFILLTGCRPGEAAGLTSDELQSQGWVLPARRNKVKLDLLRPLSKAALGVLPVGNGKFVFATRAGTSPRGSLSRAIIGLHKASGTSGWTWHDLRRTTRTLLPRTKVVSVDIAERCLGHVVGGVRGVYDHYEYKDEKAAAYDALAALIARIVDPPGAENVTPLRRTG
jgi:integrase